MDRTTRVAVVVWNVLFDVLALGIVYLGVMLVLS